MKALENEQLILNL